MKKRLLRPPQNDSELLFLPAPGEFLSSINEQSRLGVAHQPYFFNPGVSVKFILLDQIQKAKTEIIFLDTDRVRLNAKIPFQKKSTRLVSFINSERVLCDYPTPDSAAFIKFFNAVEDGLKKFTEDSNSCLSHFLRFKWIVLKNTSRKFLRELLADSFLEFYGMDRSYSFLSDLLNCREFEEFFARIYNDDKRFRELFNKALDDYRAEFRFRFKNFPFPKLQDGELPFWVLRNGIRLRCFKGDLNEADIGRQTIFPRAATLTIFLRLYKLDLLLHGVGAANYEWVQDRVIEDFFNCRPPRYAVASGTFLLEGFTDRDLPYFFFSPERIKERVRKFFKDRLGPI